MIAAIWRYMVGAVNSTLARWRSIAPSSVSGVPRSSNTTEAPTRIGKHSMPPSPKVNASGGVPQKTSSDCGRSTCRGNRSHIATMSRWKCIVPFGVPVVPEVNAISATSSCAVSQAAKRVGISVRWVSSASGAPLPSLKNIACFSDGVSRISVSSSLRSAMSHRAAATFALATTGARSFARSSGIVGTATSPALIVASRQAAIIGLFVPRSSTRLPGTRPMRSRNACAIWFTRTYNW